MVIDSAQLMNLGLALVVLLCIAASHHADGKRRRGGDRS